MRRQAGFTLIELLVSMTLLGLLMVLLLGGLRFGSRAWERSTTTADAGETVRSVQSLLRTEIERACPRPAPVTDPQAPPRVLFTGSAQSLRLFAPAPGSMGGSSCTAQLLTVHRDGKLQRLRLSIGDTHSDLVRGARAVALAYLPRDGDWRDDWAGEPVLPVLVRVRVAFPPGDTRVWPELFIAPRISAGADCTYDPATKSCRGM